MAAYRRVDDLRSPAGWLPVHRDQLRSQRSVSSMGSLYLFTSSLCRKPMTDSSSQQWSTEKRAKETVWTARESTGRSFAAQTDLRTKTEPPCNGK